MTPEPAAVHEARKVADAIFRLSDLDVEGYEWRLQEAARLITTYAAAQVKDHHCACCALKIGEW
jgi:hypothetical protein